MSHSQFHSIELFILRPFSPGVLIFILSHQHPDGALQQKIIAFLSIANLPVGTDYILSQFNIS